MKGSLDMDFVSVPAMRALGSSMLDTNAPRLIVVFAVIIVAVVLMKLILPRIHTPAIVGFILLGVCVRLIDRHYSVLTDGGEEALDVLGRIGVVLLLFRVGLESDLKGLMRQLRESSVIWIGNVLVNFVAAYLVGRYVLSLPAVPSAVIATALTATSIGIGSSLWRDMDALGTPEGERFLDVAEMDDLSGVLLMAILFAVLAGNGSAGDGGTWSAVGSELGMFAVKFVVFAAACFLYARYIEEKVTGLLTRLTSANHLLLVVVSTGLIVAGLAALLGFSMAIGAFFAGLAYSRDPQKVKMDRSMVLLYELFVPFFFISIGFAVVLGSVWAALPLACVLLGVAVAGKLLGDGLPSLLYNRSLLAAAVLGVSMVPRVEICLLIAARAQAMGPEVLPSQAYAAIVLVAAATVLLTPLVLRPLLRRQLNN